MDVALEKIRAGLTGQVRPLREFGVLLSKSAVDHVLMAQGVQKVHGEFTEQEKVMARVKIITEGLAKAQGDHERTMGSYINQQRKLRGTFENYSTGIGAGVAGEEAKLMVTAVEEGVFPAISRFGKDFWRQMIGDKDTAYQKAADVAAGVQVGLTAEMFKEKPSEIMFRDYATEGVIADLQEEKNMLDEIASAEEYAAKNRRSMEEVRFFAEFASFDTMKPEKRRAMAKEEDEFMEQFLGLDIPEARAEKAKQFRSQTIGVAEFASKLRSEQGAGDVGEKQLSELQGLRKQEADSTKAIVDAITAGSVALLG